MYEHQEQNPAKHPASEQRFVELPQAINTEPPIRGEIISSDSERFLEEARRFHAQEGAPCEFVSFNCYWPTFTSLNEQQRRWYFHWRSEARRGNYLLTDTSYLFLHAYETLNLVEKPDPLEAAAYLKALWRTYRQGCKEINLYFPEWSGDLIAEHASAAMAMDWWEEMMNDVLLPAPILNSLIQRASYDNKLDELPMNLWLRLAHFRPDNEFCELHNRDGKVTETYHSAITIADMYWRAKTGNSIVEQFVGGDLTLMKKELFTSAPVGRGHPIVWLEAAREYADNPALSSHLSSVIKHAENVLREQATFRQRLTGVELTQELKTIIKDILLYGQTPPPAAAEETRVAPSSQISPQIAKSELPSLVLAEKTFVAQSESTSVTVVAETPAPPQMPANSQRLRLDHLLIEKLRRESEEIGLLLGDVADEPSEQETIQVVTDTPIEEASALHSSVDDWQRLFFQLTQVEKALVKALLTSSALSASEVEELAREHGLMPTILTDGLNDKTTEIFERPLIFDEDGRWVLYDEDDLDSLESRLNLRE